MPTVDRGDGYTEDSETGNVRRGGSTGGGSGRSSLSDDADREERNRKALAARAKPTPAPAAEDTAPQSKDYPSLGAWSEAMMKFRSRKSPAKTALENLRAKSAAAKE